MWRHIASNALTLFIVILVVLGGVVGWAQSQYRTVGPLAQAICLKVERGSNMLKVSKTLEAQGAISNGMVFRVGADYQDKSAALKAGSFLVPDGASMEAIVDIVTRGGPSTCGTEIVFRVGVLRNIVQVRELDPVSNRFVETMAFDPAADVLPPAYQDTRDSADVRYRIALAEGATSWQIIEALTQADFLKGTVEVPAEGGLAPDSYEVQEDGLRSELVAQMQARQIEILDEAWRNRAEGLPVASKEEALILASIIEKETGLPEERGQVASVFVNRLNRGIRLQTDPTVIYGVTKGRGSLGRGLRQSELRGRTPYNTYIIDGLPPTPIANPGKAAIEAALNPDSTDFIFFVADGTGGHAFAETLAEHNSNVAAWRKIEAESSQN